VWTLWEALARWDADSGTRLGESRLTREEALRLAVQTGHQLTWSEDRRGSLEPGKDADLVVLGGNPLTCPEERIADLSVDLTVVGGRIVHQRPGASGPAPR
jgi:predicted amidohydrolase YtcJ